jgi:5,10-methenyltetrahydromethanopterin hydrogenase
MLVTSFLIATIAVSALADESVESQLLDSGERVKRGIFHHENIMIHIGQNLFNFVTSTLAWLIVSQIYHGKVTFRESVDDVLGAISDFVNRLLLTVIA